MVIDTQGPLSDSASPDDEPPLFQSIAQSFTSILRRRRRLWAIASATLFLTAAAFVMMMPSKYSATAVVKMNPSASAALGQISGNEHPDQNVLDTEISVVRSRDVALRVLEKITDPKSGINDPEWKPLAANLSTGERATRLNNAATGLMSRLDAERDGMTYLVKVSYTSASPQSAAAIANSFAEEYINFSLAGRRAKAASATGYMEQRLSQLNKDAAEADTRLAEFSASNGMVAKSGPDSIDQQIGSLAGQLAQAKSEAAAAQAKLQTARAQAASGGLESVSAVIDSAVIASLKAQKAQLLQQQSEARTRYGPKYPISIAINEQLNQNDAQIREEAQRIIGSLNSEARAAAARADSLQGEMSRLGGMQSSTTRASATAETLKREADTAHTSYNQLAEQTRQISQVSESAISQAQVVERAIPPSKPTSPNRPALIAAALIASLILPTLLVIGIEVMSPALYSSRDVERALKVPVIGTIPLLTAKELTDAESKLRLTPHDYMIKRKASAYSEAFRVLRRAILPHKVLTITSAVPDEGKSTIAVALARICALAGEKVLIIDVDIRRATLAAAMELNVERGLVEYLAGEISIDEAIVADGEMSTQVLPIVHRDFPTNDLFADPKFIALIDELKLRYDRIILDTPPVLSVVDSRHAAAISDASVLVLRWGSTPAKAAQNALRMLEIDGTKVAGAVLSQIDKTAEEYGQVYYSYRYSGYYLNQ